MKKTAVLVLALAAFSVSAQSYMKDKAFYVFSDGFAAKVEADGKISWRSPRITQVGDLWAFPSSVLFTTYNGVREVGLDGKELFSYQPADKPQIYACQKLDNGFYLVAECTKARLIEVNAAGTIRKEIKLNATGIGGHGFMRVVRKTEAGTYLVGQLGGKAREYDGDGKLVWSFTNSGFGSAYAAVRLKNGNTMIAFGENEKASIVEVNPAKEVVWSLTNKDLEGQTDPAVDPLKFATGFFVLPNGNILASNWIGHGHLGKSSAMFEINRDKKIVWAYANHAEFKTVSSVFPMDAKGNPLDGNGVH